MRHKIAQLLVLGFEGSHVDSHSKMGSTLQRYPLGGVILFDYDCRTQEFDRNIKSPKQLRSLTTQLQHLAQEGQQHAALDEPLPLLIAIDYEGGEVVRLQESYGFPATYACAELPDLDSQSVTEQFNTMAQTLSKSGVNVNFAPVVDLSRNQGNPIIAKRKRAFSDDAIVVTEFAEQFIQAARQHQIICSLKHFPGHGSSDHDTHHGFVDISDSWDPMELEPYRRLLSQEGLVDMVITSHVFNRHLDPDNPATLSHSILTGLLRDKLGFNGVIVSDDMQMDAITHAYGLEDAVIQAVNAGCDLLVFGNQLGDSTVDAEQLIDIIEQAVEQGHIPMERIDSSYQRILSIKRRVAPVEP